MLFGSWAVNHNISAILQTRMEWSGHDSELRGAYIGDPSGTLQEISSSGGLRFYVSPQINYSIKQKWNISLLFDMPVYQYCNGLQLFNKYSFALSLSRLFKLYEAKSHHDDGIPDPFDAVEDK